MPRPQLQQTANTTTAARIQRRWQKFRNCSNETVPAYGLLALAPYGDQYRLTAAATASKYATSKQAPFLIATDSVYRQWFAHEMDGSEPVLLGCRPGTLAQAFQDSAMLACNSEVPVAPDAIGLCTQDWPALVLHDGGTDVLPNGWPCGPENGLWSVVSSGRAFTCLGHQVATPVKQGHLHTVWIAPGNARRQMVSMILHDKDEIDIYGMIPWTWTSTPNHSAAESHPTYHHTAGGSIESCFRFGWTTNLSQQCYGLLEAIMPGIYTGHVSAVCYPTSSGDGGVVGLHLMAAITNAAQNGLMATEYLAYESANPDYDYGVIKSTSNYHNISFPFAVWLAETGGLGIVGYNSVPMTIRNLCVTIVHQAGVRGTPGSIYGPDIWTDPREGTA